MSVKTMRLVKRGFPLYLFILPGFLYFMLFRYAPMFGISIAFMDYDIFDGIFKSPFAGLSHFIRFFSHADFLLTFKNTLFLSFFNLLFYFPMPIIFALMLHECKNRVFRKLSQTLTYLPHFISWVVVVSITVMFFNSREGVINIMLDNAGLPKIPLFGDPKLFRLMYVSQNIWKETGWSAIIFLAALASVDPTLYDAAMVDGASRLQRVVFINLPSLLPTIIILFILRLGQVMNTGFEHIFLIQNSLNRSVSEVFDTYVYKMGLRSGQFSYAAAVGLFKGAIGLFLMLTANKAAKLIGQEGIY